MQSFGVICSQYVCAWACVSGLVYVCPECDTVGLYSVCFIPGHVLSAVLLVAFPKVAPFFPKGATLFVGILIISSAALAGPYSGMATLKYFL